MYGSILFLSRAYTEFLIVVFLRAWPACEELFVFDGERSVWRRDLVQQVEVFAVRLPLLSGCAAQVYKFGVAVGHPDAKAMMYWSMPHMAAAVYDMQDHQDCLQSMQATMDKQTTRLGISAHCWRPSRRSHEMMKQKHGADCVPRLDGTPLQFPSATTRLCLLYLLHWSYSDARASSSRAAAATAILSHLIDHACDAAFMVVDSSSIQIIIRDSMVDISSLAGARPAALRNLFSRMAPTPDSCHVPVDDFVVKLYAMFRTPSRASAATLDIVVDLLGKLLAQFELQIDASAHEDVWRMSTCLSLKPKQRSKRPRVTSTAFREAVIGASKTTSEPVNIRQLVASTGIFDNAAVASDAAVTSNSKNFSSGAQRDYVLGALAVGKLIFKDVPLLHLSNDGVQASGRHNEIFIALDPISQHAFVPPPKVHL